MTELWRFDVANFEPSPHRHFPLFDARESQFSHGKDVKTRLLVSLIDYHAFDILFVSERAASEPFNELDSSLVSSLGS